VCNERRRVCVRERGERGERVRGEGVCVCVIRESAFVN